MGESVARLVPRREPTPLPLPRFRRLPRRHVYDTLPDAKATKEIIETDECLAFRSELNAAEYREYQHAIAQLAKDGRLEYPMAEKTDYERN